MDSSTVVSSMTSMMDGMVNGLAELPPSGYPANAMEGEGEDVTMDSLQMINSADREQEIPIMQEPTHMQEAYLDETEGNDGSISAAHGASDVASTQPPASRFDASTYADCSPAPMIDMKLFCGRVPKTMREDDVRQVFEEFGVVKEVIIIRDKDSNNHKFSAFIRMASIAHADSAIQALNGQRTLDPVLGPLQVKYANGEAAKANLTEASALEPGVHQAKVFVGSLPKNVNDDQIRELFAPYGVIDEVFIMMDKATGSGKGCAFVKFAFKEQALFAIKCLDGKRTLEGCARPVEVRFAESKAQKAQQQFNQYGAPAPVVNSYAPPMGVVGPPATMMHMPMGGGVTHPGPPAVATPRAVGPWKEYWTSEGRPYYHNEQTQITQWEKPMDFDKSLMPVGAGSAALAGSSPGSFGPKGANIFIFYVPNEWTQADLINAFGSFGMIVSARIATDKVTGRNKGYAFVSYDNAQAAAYAVHHMNGYLALAKRLKVTIKKGEESFVQHLLDQLAGTSSQSDQSRNPMYASTGQVAGTTPQYGNFMAQRYAPY